MSIPNNRNVYGTGPYAPTGKVNYGWIGESWHWFSAAAGTWIVSILIFGLIGIAYFTALSLILRPIFHMPGLFELPPTVSSGSNPQDFSAVWNQALARQSSSSAFSIVEQLLLLPLVGFMYSCLVSLALRQVKGETIGLQHLFTGGKYWLPMTVYVFFWQFANLIGLLCCVIGAAFAAALFMPARAFICDGEPVMSAIGLSFEVVKNDLLNAAAFNVVLVAMTALAAVPCGLGLIVVAPMLNIIYALAYRDMIGWGGSAGGDPFAHDSGAWPPPPGPPI